jgi:hypothetical protein
MALVVAVELLHGVFEGTCVSMGNKQSSEDTSVGIGIECEGM